MKYFIHDTSRPLVVTFANLGALASKNDIVNGTSPWGFDFVKSIGLNVLAFASCRPQNWYRSIDFFEFINRISDALPVFSERLGYGGSMGGYGVSAYANLLKLDRVLLFNPISTLNESLAPWETRFAGGRQLDWESGAFDGAQISCPGYIVYDPLFNLDRLHALRYSSNITHLKVFGVGHAIPKHLRDMGVLKNLVTGFFSNDIDVSLAQREFRRRRTIIRNYNWLLSPENQRLTPKRIQIIGDARNRFLRKQKAISVDQTLINSDVTLLRDSAIALEKIDLQKSYKLMKLAAEFRKGPFIKEKLKEYEQRLNNIEHSATTS